jgi:hypothetical protein
MLGIDPSKQLSFCLLDFKIRVITNTEVAAQKRRLTVLVSPTVRGKFRHSGRYAEGQGQAQRGAQAGGA